jgi:hypothetical protein
LAFKEDQKGNTKNNLKLIENTVGLKEQENEEVGKYSVNNLPPVLNDIFEKYFNLFCDVYTS